MKKIEITMMPIDSIIPYWRNPRIHNSTVNALAEAIKRYGFNVPLVIDKNNVVVKGHARLKAARMLGLTEVPCIVTDADDAKNKADRIADNKIQELSKWDPVKLEVESLVFEGTDFASMFKPVEIQVERLEMAETDAQRTTEGNSAASVEVDASKTEAPTTNENAGKVRAVCPVCGASIYV